MNDIVVSPDESHIYTSSQDRTVRKLDASTGDEAWQFTGHSDTVNGLARDADGNIYTTSTDGQVLRLSSGGDQQWSYTYDSVGTTAVAVDSSDQVYIATDDYRIHRREQDGTRTWEYTGHTGTIKTLQLSSTESYVYSGASDSSLRKLDPSTSDLLWMDTNENVFDIEVASSGSVYVGGYTVRRFASDGTLQWSYDTAAGRVRGIGIPL